MEAKRPVPGVFSQTPDVMSGAVVFKGTRILAQTFFDHIDDGGTIEQFREWYENVDRWQLEAAAKATR
ncbi:MAG TPA: DUF433 domain-containing protein [Opitutaceae bacterium]|nr:DUF433 domain-containing protein [Opitutaceae bacterium]